MKWTHYFFKGFAFLYNYSGLRFVVIKFTGKPANDPSYRAPPSGMLWALGLYVAALGLAGQRYSNAIDTATVLQQNPLRYDATDLDDDCVNFIEYLDEVHFAPVKPDLFNFTSVIQSLFSGPVPIMDEIFFRSREKETSIWVRLATVIETTNSDGSQFLEFGRIIDVAQRENIKKNSTLHGIYVWADALETGILTERPHLEIDARTVPQLYEQCSESLLGKPKTVDDAYLRFLCTVNALAWSCADPPREIAD